VQDFGISAKFIQLIDFHTETTLKTKISTFFKSHVIAS
jgi:hypothetical protein